MPLNAVVVGPFQDRATGELRPVVTDNASRFAIEPGKCIQFPCHPCARDAGVSHQAEVLTAAIIIHSQDAEPTRCAEGIGQEVQRPSFTRPKSFWHRRACPTSPLAPTSSPDAQFLLRIEAIQLLVVHDHSLAFQHHPDPPIAEPAAFVGNGLHLLADLRIVRRTITPNGFGVDTDKTAGPTLRDVMLSHRLKRCRSPLSRCR